MTEKKQTYAPGQRGCNAQVEKFHNFLKIQPVEEQHAFAKKIGTSLAHLRSAINRHVFGLPLAIKIELGTQGFIKVEDIRPDYADLINELVQFRKTN